MNEQKMWPRARRTVLAVCWVALGAACGGVASTPSVGSESHFLAHCEGACGGGLECIGGICTRACRTDVASCSELGAGALCTNQSVEPGQVAVCDVSCTDTSGCAALGRSYTCEGGFCRTGTGTNLAGATPDAALPGATPRLGATPTAATPPGASAACVGPACAQCPAPGDAVRSEGEPQWARHPETGVCCEYADFLATPDGWPAFSTPSECENDCRCSVLEGQVGDFYTSDRTTLDCRCAGGDCPSTPEEAQERFCRGRPTYRRQGCGLIAIATAGFYGESWVFTDGVGSPPSLVGAYSYSDTRSSPCQTFESIAGREFECEEAVECLLCGEDPEAQPCD